MASMSARNPSLKPVRDSDGREILYGRQPVREALRAGRRDIFRLCMLRDPRPTPDLEEIRALAARRGAPVRDVERGDLARLTDGGNHQGVALEASAYPYSEFEELAVPPEEKKNPPLILLLDHIEDPQNVGSLLRTAEAAGVSGVVLPVDRAAPVTPAAVRASSGASEHLRICRVVNLVRAMNALKEEGVWLAGLEMAPEAKPLAATDLTGPLGLVVGSEGHGMGRLVRETCDHLVYIPMFGKVSSLNAGVAGGIALFEIRRQRAAAEKPLPETARKRSPAS